MNNQPPSNSVIVANLPLGSTSSFVMQIFQLSNSDIIDNCITIKNAKEPLVNGCYAIIAFKTFKIAKQIITKFNKATYKNRSLYLFFKTDKIKYFIKNSIQKLIFLIDSPTITTEYLSKTFLNYGPISSLDFDSENKKGSVTFYISINALRALQDLSRKDKQIPIKFVFPRIAKSKNGFSTFVKHSKNQNNEITSIFAFDIQPYAEESLFREIFKDYEVVPDDFGVIIKQRSNYDGKKVNYAVISFKTRYQAIRAISDLNYASINKVSMRLVLADEKTINILKTNKGKILIKNLDPKIDVIQLHEAFSNFGNVIECEIPNDNGVSRGYGYVHFDDAEVASKTVVDLEGASIEGRPIEASLCHEANENDPEKQFLYECLYDKPKLFNEINVKSPKQKIFESLNSINDVNGDDTFFIFVDDVCIHYSKFILAFLSHSLFEKIQSNESFLSLTISVDSFLKDFQSYNDLFNFLISELIPKQTKKYLKNRIIKKIQEISDVSIKCQSNYYDKIAKNCSTFCIKVIENQKQKNINDSILDFIIVFKIFIIFENKITSEQLIELFFNYIKKDINNIVIKNDEVLLKLIDFKEILNFYSMLLDFENEKNYIVSNFFEINPDVMNQISLDLIKFTLSDIGIEDINEDLFLYQIMRFNNEYTKSLLKFVKFNSISNKAMKYFIENIKLSDLNDEILGVISVRLSIPLKADIYLFPFYQIKAKIFFSEFEIEGIEDTFKTLNSLNFTFCVDDIKIECNSFFSSLISPIISNKYQTDITLSSFSICVDSFIEDLRIVYKSLSFFACLKSLNFDSSVEKVKEKIVDAIKNIIKDKNISSLINLLFNKFNEIEINEQKNIVLNCAIYIQLFNQLGNFSFSENLINLFLFETNKIKKITDKEVLYQRIEYKEKLNYNNNLNIDFSPEIMFIISNFNSIISDLNSIDDIDGMLWKVISIRLSLPIEEGYDLHIHKKELKDDNDEFEEISFDDLYKFQ